SLGDGNGLRFVLDDDVRHAVGDVHVDRADFFGFHDAEPAALDHRGTAHPDGRVACCDDDITAAEERRVAGEAASGVDADEGHESAQLCEEVEGHDVEAGDTGGVGVPRTSATSFREDD